MPHATDLDLSTRDVAELASPDSIAAFFAKLGYDTAGRATLSPEAIGLSGESAGAIKRIETLSEDPEQFLRVVFAQAKSLTAKVRNDLVRVLGRGTLDHLLVLASDFDTLEFVFLDKRKREQKGPASSERIQVVAKVISVNRRNPTRLDLKALRRFTWTCRDALDQFDKLRSVFDAAAYTGEYFQNRGLFSDHFLRDRLRDDPVWRENPSELFAFVRDLMRDAQGRWARKDEEKLRDELLQPLFKRLGFDAVVNRPGKGDRYVLCEAPSGPSRQNVPVPFSATSDQTQPDYLLKAADGKMLTAAFVYAWDRWLDGPDLNDADTPEENPGACVVTALDAGIADWIVVTNGRLWRLYSRQAHARATNFYEVDLVEALTASGDTDPNEAFRYWSLFFRPEAFQPCGVGVPPATRSVGVSPAPDATETVTLRTDAAGTAGPHVAQPPSAVPAKCWLDGILVGSREYAKRLGERLKDRIFVTIFPHLAQGFLADRKQRLGQNKKPNDAELADIFEATLTLLYRLLFLLYAESRDLLPIREAPYHAASLKKIKEEISERAGVAESGVAETLEKAYSAKETTLYDRLCQLFRAMDKGDPVLNVPTYNGGLFMQSPLPLPLGEGRGEGGTKRKKATQTDDSAFSEATSPHPSPLPEGEGTRALPPLTHEQRISRFLAEHKIPDRHLALAIDRLARDEDERTLALVFVDYKSLEVRHLGSIYEGLLEFHLRVADEDLTTQADKKGEKYIPLKVSHPQAGTRRERPGSSSKASGRRKPPSVVVRKGDVYLSNDKAQRKASGSYYTPDPIVKYIVEQTVGPVLAEKLEGLRPEFRKVRKTFDNELQKSKAYPPQEVKSGQTDHREWAGLKTYQAHKSLVESLFEFRVLDPAMGSGHFLVEAVDFITDRLLTFLNQFPVNPVTFMLTGTRRNIVEALTEQGVSVDDRQLTDINLLKRHVLKRCIYGVDLNPMAVELAKVSLWLDAFTLGAPLSFLDHHLRSGNSLIGATFKDLAAATKGRLFGIDYEPLLRAVRHVLQVNKMADATAAEVKHSASEYDHAREELSGYQIVLDLLVAKHFGHPKAPGLLEHGDDLKLDSRARFMASLDDLEELALVERVESIARQADRRFFHWEIEFPEVFFAFADANERHLKHKNDVMEGSAGFDAVVGNPPYVRMECIKPLKAFLKAHYSCHSERADLLIYFFEMAIGRCRSNAVMSFIASSNWTKTTAGEPLRNKLIADTQILHYLDFSSTNVFPEASTYPAVVVVRNGRPTDNHMVHSVQFGESLPIAILNSSQTGQADVLQRSLANRAWTFEGGDAAALRSKLFALGRRFGDIYGSPLYGIKTGCNEAFVIDETTREEIVAKDRRNAEIIKPFLEGKDVRPWHVAPRQLWLINAVRGVPMARYPAILEYLGKFRTRLEARATRQEWYELQQAQFKYQPKYAGPKLVYPRFVEKPTFAFDTSGSFINNALSAVPLDDPAVLFALMSPVTWFFLSATGAPMANGYRQIHGHVLEEVPLPLFSNDARSRIAEFMRGVDNHGQGTSPPWEIVYEAFQLTPKEVDLIATEGKLR